MLSCLVRAPASPAPPPYQVSQRKRSSFLGGRSNSTSWVGDGEDWQGTGAQDWEPAVYHAS